MAYYHALLEDRAPPPWPPPQPVSTTAQTQSQQPAGGNMDSRISPSILLIIAILAVIFFLSGLLHLLIRFLFRPPPREAEDADNATALQGQLQQLFHLHDAGVDQSFIDTLPVFLYRAVTGAAKDDEGHRRRPFDCAVCLCEFEGDDRLRLLPKCSHAFHVDCIDTWLLSHSTCPLCRRSLFPDLSSPSASPTRACGGPLVLVLESGGGSSGNTSGREIVPEGGGGGVSAVVACQNDNSLVDIGGGSGGEEQRQPTAVVARTASSIDGRKLCDGGGIKEDPLPPAAAAGEGTCRVVPVKLGKFRNLGPAEGGGGGGGEGSSSGIVSTNPNHLNDRRCFSMGSFEYVMDERSHLQVAIEYPLPKKQTTATAAAAGAGRRRRMAVSECDCHSQREEGFKGFLDTLAPLAHHPASSSIATGAPKKESFSVSKIWLRGRRDNNRTPAAGEDGSRRSFSFRRGAAWSTRDLNLPKGKMNSGGTTSMAPASEFDSGSELGADVEAGSCDGSGRKLSRGEEMPSFARRTLMWVLGRNQKVVSHT